jgi:hypothetical protein
MPYKNRMIGVLLLTLSVLTVLSLQALAQQTTVVPRQANLSDIGSATITLYYYDDTNGTIGAMVPVPDNPQQVNNDTSKSAPGMYVFPQVPAGSWYYLEADRNGNEWYTIFYMPEKAGTVTANVDIPPLEPLNSTAADTPSVTPNPTARPTASPTITPEPSASASPTATPGMTILPALLAGCTGILIALRRR